MLKKFYKILYSFVKQMSTKNISAFAASTAFFLFISLIPILYLVCSILPYTRLTEEAFRQSVENIAPGVVGIFLDSIIVDVYDQSAGVVSLAIIVMFWSAGKGMLALMRGLNAVNGVEENKNYFVVRIIAAVYTVLLIAAIMISVLLNGLGKFILKLLVENIPGGSILYSLLGHLRFLYGWAILTILFMVIYSYVPGKNQRFIFQIPGAVFTAVIWSAFSWAFSVYVEYFGNFGIYGSLATVVLVLFWFYCMCYIVMIGAHINRYFEPANKFLWDKRSKRQSRKR